MRFNFADASRPARMSKLVRTAFSASERNLGLLGAQDVCARMYGYPTYHEMKACVGKGAPCRWDEQVPDHVASDRRTWQVASLVTDGLPRAAAETFVDRYRPTGTSHGPARGSHPIRPLPSPAGVDGQLDGMMELLVSRAIKENATDIHIEPRLDDYVVHFLRLGERTLVHMGSIEEYEIVVSQLKDRSRMRLSERRVGQDGGFQIEHEGRWVDLRVATVPAIQGEQILIHILDPDRERFDLEQLGISRLTSWRKGITRQSGLCLICGETGAGKTTTLNASVRKLDHFGKRIHSTEGPVEYLIPFLGLVSLNSTARQGYPELIERFKDINPDVVVLGELRDGATARTAVKEAAAGRMVIATLHTDSILSSLMRLLDLGIQRSELRTLLRSILVQRLVKISCKGCGGTGRAGAASCATCHGSGYSDRTAVSECHSFGTHGEVDASLDFLGRDGTAAQAVPWISMLDDGIEKMLGGTVPAEEMRRHFGSRFDDRCAERGIDPSTYAWRRSLET